MKKETINQVNYRQNARKMQVKFDEFFGEKEIPASDSVRLINQIVEEMDITSLLSTYKRTGRPTATSPSIMLQVMIYGYMEAKKIIRGLRTSPRNVT